MRGTGPDPVPVHVVVYAQSLDRLSRFYGTVLGLVPVEEDARFVVWRGPGYELSIVAVPDELARQIEVASPPEVREDTPVKASFLVASVEACRAAVEQGGGTLKPADAGWAWRGQWHLDGVDPEGNVFQLRQPQA